MGRQNNQRRRAFLSTQSARTTGKGPMPVVACKSDGITIYEEAIPELEAALQRSIEHGYEPGKTVRLYRDQIKNKPKMPAGSMLLAFAAITSMGHYYTN